MLDDDTLMARAIANAGGVRRTTSPNPWVGAVVATADGRVFDGATEPPGARHAEVVALDGAGDDARGATLVTTLEPCRHTGRTPPCVDRIIHSQVARVVVGVEDPDPNVAGRGIAALEAAGIQTTVGVRADEVAAQLAPYLHHRRTGRPYVVLKLATTLDGRTAAADGTSRWITGPEARADVHRLRAAADAVLVGAGTVRADDPELTVRDANGPDPLRVVLGSAPRDARVHPCLELSGDLEHALDTLGGQGVLELLVEGGASVAAAFHRAGLVDEYVLYLAPAFLGSEGRPLLDDTTTTTIADAWRGRIRSVERLGGDLKVVVTPGARHT